MVDHPTINANGADPNDRGSENETQAGREGKQWHPSPRESGDAAGDRRRTDEGRSS